MLQSACSLTMFKEKCARKISTEGIPLILTTMEFHLDNPSVQEKATGVILNLSEFGMKKITLLVVS